MSSLWTPEGERPVRRPAPGTGQAGAPDGGGPPAGAPPPGDGSPGDRPPGDGPPHDRSAPDHGDAEAEIARLRRELQQVPAAVVVANHAYGLFELAAIHLSAQPPNLPEARLAVDALGAIVDALGDRLQEAAGPLHDALAQMRLAFVQLSASPAPPADTGHPSADGS